MTSLPSFLQVQTVTRKQLIDLGFSLNTIDSLLQRGQIETLGHGVYEVGSLPEEWREQVGRWQMRESQRAFLRRQADLAEQEEDAAWAVEQGMKMQLWAAFRRQAGWMRYLSEATLTVHFNHKKEMWAAAQELMNEEIEAGRCYGRKMNNPKSLEVKAIRYKKDGLDSLVDFNRNNKNAAKAWDWAKPLAFRLYCNADPTGQAHLKVLAPELYKMFGREYERAVSGMELATRPGKVYRGFCRVNFVNRETGEEIEIAEGGGIGIGYSTFYNYLTSREVQERAALHRHGKSYFDRSYGAYVKGRKPEYIGSLWSADDYDMNFWVLDSQGRFSYRRVSFYIVWCATTGIPLGFSWTMRSKETHQLTVATIWEAVYDALCFTGGRLGLEIELDGWAKNSPTYKEAMGQLFRHVTFRERAQGKYAEVFNKEMQDRFLHLKPGYLGGNIQDKKQDSKRMEDGGHYAPANYPRYTPNDLADFMREYRAMKLGLVGGKEQVLDYSKTWAQVVAGQYEEKYGRKYHPAYQAANPVLLAASAVSHGTEVTLRNGFADIQVRGRSYSYDVDMEAILGTPEGAEAVKTGKVWVRGFLPESVSGLACPLQSLEERAYLFGSNGVYLGEARRAREVVRAKAEQTEADREALNHYEAKKARQAKALKTRAWQAKEATKELLDGPKPKPRQESREIDLSYLDITATWEAAKATGQDEKALAKQAEEQRIAELLAGARWKLS